MKKLLNNIRAWKSTLLGLALIAFSLFIIIEVEGVNEYLASGILIAGLSLFFVPDTFIHALERFLLNKSEENKKDGE